MFYFFLFISLLDAFGVVGRLIEVFAQIFDNWRWLGRDHNGLIQSAAD